MIETITVIVSVIVASVIILYATWLFVHKLRAGESKAKSFGEWLKHLFEAIMGL
jgi:hypothetical protein